MSRIKVWTSEGEWSKETIEGLDKVFVLKSGIAFEAMNDYNYHHSLGHSYDSALELDGCEIYTDLFDSEPVDVEWPRDFHKYNPTVDLTKVKLFKLRLDTFKHIAAKHDYLKPAFKAIFDAAKVVKPTPKNFCLLLKFEEE